MPGEGQLRLDVPAARGHLVGDREDVAGAVGRQRDEGRVRCGDDLHAVDLRESSHDRVRALEGGACEPLVALVTEGAHHRPGSGQRPSRLRRLEGRVEHRVAGPVGTREELRPPQRGLAVQQQGRALGRVRVLVQVDRDARDALDVERPGRDRATEALGVRQQPAADAGVDVAPGAGACRHGGDLGDGVHHPVGVRRCGGDDEHGAPVDRLGHGRRVRAEVLAHRDGTQLDAEVVRGLVEGGVRRRRAPPGWAARRRGARRGRS